MKSLRIVYWSFGKSLRSWSGVKQFPPLELGANSNRRSLAVGSSCPSCSLTTTVMAAAARLFIRGANSKLSIAPSSLGVTLLKLSPNCSSRTKTQRRHATHFTFQPDPVPSQYGECLANRLTWGSGSCWIPLECSSVQPRNKHRNELSLWITQCMVKGNSCTWGFLFTC